MYYNKLVLRSVAQSGSARGLGPWGRGFESSHSDQLSIIPIRYDGFFILNMLFKIFNKNETLILKKVDKNLKRQEFKYLLM